ncbi:hypothetical protein [Streptomyces sp. NPDC047079]|uniref:hypothetical protein n=1 Tax=Streptomyces sp. NPDC047079 TaxID=3154607 RepID=UPI0033C56308
MTVPEENRPKTDTTDEVVSKRGDDQDEKSRTTPGPSGRTIREAMDEAGIKREDFEDR